METTTSNSLVIVNEHTKESTKLDFVAIKSAAMTLRAINHKLRQQIVKLLNENKRMTQTFILGIQKHKYGAVSFELQRLTCNDERFFKELN